VISFSRAIANQTLIALTGRFFLKLCNSHGKPVGDVWGNTTVALPKKVEYTSFRDIFTGETITAEPREDGLVLPVSKVFSHCPVALLFAESAG
jgi:(1->4)-alpha-D-glucan 1-alpha-D-glucosylmutase